jgi:prepilin-type N-terminal cleavage/methylation domain-containing protein
MIQQFRHPSPARRGYTMLEVTVAMTVLGIALSGLFPLLAILSRNLQPARKIAADGTASYDCRTPARDGNTDGTGVSPPPVYLQHVWYLTAAGDANTTPDPNVTAWVRKLGASATAGTVSFSAGAAACQVGQPIIGPIHPGDPGYSEMPLWTSGTLSTSPAGHYQAVQPTGGSVYSANWTFNVPVTGWYYIEASWPANPSPPITLTTVNYQISGSTTTYACDQTVPDTGIADGQGTWHNVTPQPINISSGAATVTLSVPCDGQRSSCSVIASGVRLVRNDVRVIRIDRSLSDMNKNSSTPSADVTAHVSVTVNIPQ